LGWIVAEVEDHHRAWNRTSVAVRDGDDERLRHRLADGRALPVAADDGKAYGIAGSG
jgi:hypothetical protein